MRLKLLDWIHNHLLFVIMILGFVLRLISLESRSLQYDDVFSIFLSARSFPEIITGTAADTMPPLYYFLLHFWMMISQQIWIIRLLSVFISLPVIALVFFIVEYWIGRPAADWAAFLTAISPLQIYHAQDIRMYMLLVLGQAGYIWFFTRLWFLDWKGWKRLANWSGLVICGLVAVYSHNLAIFALAVPNLFLLTQKRWRMLSQLFAAQMVIGLIALPWWMLLPGQLQKIQQAFWTPRPGMVEILQAVIMFTAALPLPPVLMVIVAVLSIQILAVIAIELWRHGRQEIGVTFLTGLLFIPPLLLFVVSYLMRPVFVPRGFLVSSLAYYGLAGFAITRSWSRGAGKLIAGAFILAAVISLPSYYTFRSFPRSPYREAATYLRQEIKPDSVIIHDTKLSYFPMHFYDPDLPQVFVADAPGSTNDTFALASQQAMDLYPMPDLPSAASTRQRIYFITYSQVFKEYEEMNVGEHPGIKWLDYNFHFVDRKVFNDLEIFQYEK